MMMRCCSLSDRCTTRLAYLAKLWLKNNSNKLTRNITSLVRLYSTYCECTNQ